MTSGPTAFYVISAAMILWGAFLATPGGAGTAVKMWRLNHRRPQRESDRINETRNNRIAGMGMIVCAIAVMLIATF